MDHSRCREEACCPSSSTTATTRARPSSASFLPSSSCQRFHLELSGSICIGKGREEGGGKEGTICCQSCDFAEMTGQLDNLEKEEHGRRMVKMLSTANNYEGGHCPNVQNVLVVWTRCSRFTLVGEKGRNLENEGLSRISRRGIRTFLQD